MAKYYGRIGYIKTEETVPGVWSEKVIEKTHYGDVERNYKQFQLPSENIIDNITLNNSISIVANPYISRNYPYIRYLWWNGVPWNVTSVTVEYPRFILNLGGVYNGKTPETSSDPCCSCEECVLSTP